MRARLLGIIVIGLAVALAAPSSAAPDRTLTLTKDATSATWNGALSLGTDPIGGYFGTLECAEPTQGCDETLIQLRTPGALTVVAKNTSPLPRYLFMPYEVQLFRSDATGRAGQRLAVSPLGRGEEVVSARGLAAGHYLVRVSYKRGVGSYAGRATFVPAGR